MTGLANKFSEALLSKREAMGLESSTKYYGSRHSAPYSNQSERVLGVVFLSRIHSRVADYNIFSRVARR